MRTPTLGIVPALRRLRRAPLFTLVTVATLGVGIGASAALFGVVRGVLLKPLAFDEPERLVGVWHRAPGLDIDRLPQGPAFHFTYRDHGRVFEDIGMWDTGAASVTGAGEPEQVTVLRVTDGALAILRVRPLVGRIFTRQDDSPGAPERVLLSYGYWQRRFGADPGVLGRALTVDGRAREIVGVLPRSFMLPGVSPALIVLLQLDRTRAFVGNFAYQGVARLRPGVTIEQANADLARMIPLVVVKYPLPPGLSREAFDQARLGPDVRSLAADAIGDVGRVLWVLFGTAGLVLLVACANAANLFLVRTEGRQHEISVRSALGASRSQIAGELLSEGVALGLAGGGVGVALAWAALQALVAAAPDGLPRVGEIAVDPFVLLFSLAVSVSAGLLLGLFAVLRNTSRRPGALADGGWSASGSPSRLRARSALVVSQVAVALVLLAGSGLMVRTFLALRHVDPGYTRPEAVLTFRLTIPQSLVPDAGHTAKVHEQIARRLEQVPGVVSAGLSSSITMDGHGDNDPIFVEDVPEPAGRIPPVRRFKWISPNYLETMGARLLAGRTLTWADVHARATVALVSENLARHYWKDPPAAIGRRIRPMPHDAWREIIGVVADERDDGLDAPAPTVVYWPILQEAFLGQPVRIERTLGYAIRSSRLQSPGFVKEVQQAVWAVSPTLPLFQVRTLDAIRADSMSRTSLAMMMLSVAAGIALLLGAVGVYGVVAYVAAQRTREMGIRMALGAARGEVSRLFLRRGLALVGVGLVLGLGAALGLTRLLGALLFGVSPRDPATLALATVVLGGSALLAVYVPARRASRVDPLVVLRSDR